MDEQKFSHESLQDSATIQSFLGALITSLEKGRLVLSSEDQEMVMKVDKLLKFTLWAKKKSGQNKLTINISWTDTPDIRPEQGSPVSVSF